MIVVLGICHTCSEYTPLVKQDIRDKLIYRCFHCHSQYEQMINGKILFQTGGTPSSTSDVPSYTQWLIDANGALVSNASSVPNALTNAGATFHLEQNATTNKFNGLALVKNDNGWGTPLFINRLNPYSTGNLVEFESNSPILP